MLKDLIIATAGVAITSLFIVRISVISGVQSDSCTLSGILIRVKKYYFVHPDTLELVLFFRSKLRKLIKIKINTF